MPELPTRRGDEHAQATHKDIDRALEAAEAALHQERRGERPTRDSAAVKVDLARCVRARAALSQQQQPAPQAEGDCAECGAPAGYPPAGPCASHMAPQEQTEPPLEPVPRDGVWPYPDLKPRWFMRSRAWLDDDRKHVWVAHDCATGRVVSMLPWPTWRAGDGHVEPSFNCEACGLHTFVIIEPKSKLADQVSSPPERAVLREIKDLRDELNAGHPWSASVVEAIVSRLTKIVAAALPRVDAERQVSADPMETTIGTLIDVLKLDCNSFGGDDPAWAEKEYRRRAREILAALAVSQEQAEPSRAEFERIMVALIEATDWMRELIKGYKIDEAAEWLKARGFLADDEPEPETLAGLLYALEQEALDQSPTETTNGGTVSITLDGSSIQEDVQAVRDHWNREWHDPAETGWVSHGSLVGVMDLILRRDRERGSAGRPSPAEPNAS